MQGKQLLIFLICFPRICRPLRYLCQSHPTISIFLIFSYSRTSPRQGKLSDPLQFQSNKRNLRSLCAHDSSQTISFQNMLFVHSLTAGSSAESLSCPKLNFQCSVADKRKICHLSDNRRMEGAEIKGLRAMLPLSWSGEFTFESPQKMLRHQGCGRWTHARHCF